MTDEITTALPYNDAAIAAFGAIEFDLLGQGQEGVIIGTDGTLFTNQDLPIFRADALAQEATLLDFVHTNMADVQAAGTQTLIVLLPDKRRVLSDVFPHPQPEWLTSRYDRVLNQLRAEGLEVVDAREALGPLGAEGFMRNDTHWSERGTRAVADLTAQRLREIAPEFMDTLAFDLDLGDVVDVEWAGDMRTFLPMTEARAAQLYPAETIVQPYVSAAEFVDETPAITLVGTSYTGFEDTLNGIIDPWLYADFLRFGIQADIRVCSDWGQGVEVPFTDYWTRVSDGRFDRPGLLIWEIPERYFGYQIPPEDLVGTGSILTNPEDVNC